MARDWSDLFITGAAPGQAEASTVGAPPGGGDSSAALPAPSAPAAGSAKERAGDRGGVFRRLRESMARTRQALGSELQATLAGPLDEGTWERLEEALILADVGATTTAKVVETLEAEARNDELKDAGALSERLIHLLAKTATVGDDRIDISAQPTVIMAVGVNGTGKTTTVGKLAWHLQRELGRTVLLGAADTFRAAASEQLEGWARRAGCGFLAGPEGSDPGAIAFEAIARARAEGVQVVIIDTAGRLHTQDDLMAELGKVRRVIERQLPGAPHETLLTLDATTGQNGLRQAQLFAATAGVTGVVLTKLDGTARGGIALAIASELDLPVKLIGVGESLEDLRPFDAEDFARALIAES